MKLISLRTSILSGCILATMGTFLIPLPRTVAQTTPQCYDFSGPAEGTIYPLGKTINARYSTINLQKFMTINGPSQYGVQQAQIINNTALAQGDALKLTSIVTQVKPNQTAKKVTFYFAENLGINGEHDINFGVNGKHLVWRGRMDQLDGKIIGLPQFGGKVKISVNAQQDPDGNWNRGTVTLKSLTGLPLLGVQRGINVFAKGAASQLIIDDVCMTPQ